MIRTVVALAILCAFGVVTGQDAPNAGLQKPVTAYLAAKPEDRWKLVRDPDKWKDASLAFENAHPFPPADEIRITKVARISEAAVIVTAQVPRAATDPKGAEKQSDGRIIIRPGQVRPGLADVVVALRKWDDVWVVDWPATAGHNPVSFKIIKKDAPQSLATVRAHCQHDSKYFDDFVGANKTHDGYKLTDSDGVVIYGYVPNSTALSLQLRQFYSQQVTLEIRPGKESGNVCTITKIVSKTWLIDEPAPKGK